jgi:signal transduction histidine kinase
MNALEAIDSGGEIAIRLSHSAPSRQLTLEITDTGPGVPMELLPKIFEAFVTTKPEGSGLGLAICRAIADAHHAAIRAENNPTKSGMTVSLQFSIPESTARQPAADDLHTIVWTGRGLNDSARSGSTLS